MDSSGLIAGNDLLWEGTIDPDVHQTFMIIIHQMARRSGLVLDIIEVLAKAGQEKLRSHAEDHLDRGLYSTHAIVKAANTIGDATNDRTESLFGMLDRDIMIVPAMNPAKQDKPVKWIRSANIPLDKICSVAMRHARLECQEEGTKNKQVKQQFWKGRSRGTLKFQNVD